MNIRLLPPVEPSHQAYVINGRAYSAVPGGFLDVLDSDAQELQANGWVWVAPSGPTGARPTGRLGLYQASPGTLFYDTTLSKLIVCDGVNWRDPVNGNAV
jgi:hypothetical protein